jgi:diguanylate cyclase (GGDEF)-like protein
VDLPLLARQVVLVWMTVVYAFVLAAFLVLFEHSSLAPFLDARVVRWARASTVAVGLFWAAIALVGRQLARRGRTEPLLLRTFVITWTVHNLAILYLVGFFHTPLWLLLAGGVILALILLDRAPIRLGALFSVVAIATLGALQLMGAIPYAPLFVRPPFFADGQPEPTWMASQFLAIAVLLLGIWLLGDSLVTRWRERENTFRALSRVDPLTQLANRRHFMELLERECLRALRQGTPLGLLMCDVDHFKQVNDQRGHAAGDAVLRGLADDLRACIRGHVDSIGRLGGEEFAVLLPATNLEDASAVAERIRKTVEAHVFEHDGARFSVTLSVGVAALSRARATPAALLADADAELYRAKSAGRNRVSLPALEA